MKIYRTGLALLLLAAKMAMAQSNTAVTSGSIGKCRVWDFPYKIYQNNSVTKTINNGVTVNADTESNSGTINLLGNGAIDLNGSNGINFNTTGTDVTCKWDVPDNGNPTITFEYNGWVSGAADIERFQRTNIIFTNAGNYIYRRGSGWNISWDSNMKTANLEFANTFYGGEYAARVVKRVEVTSPTPQCDIYNSTPVPLTWGAADEPFKVASNSLNYESYFYQLITPFSSPDPTGLFCTSKVKITRGSAQILYDN